MYTGSFKSVLKTNANNIMGWRTKRHIVVIESDDWGSIRMSSKEAFERMLKSGIPVNRSHYNIFDSLECNDDIEHIYETLSKFKDISGRHPVITGVNIVANPNFEKIKENNFTEYIYEPYTETCKRYSNHDRVYDLWKEGIDKRLMVPIFHGREHLNVQFWMRAIKKGDKSTMIGFENGVTGMPGINGEKLPNYQAAFDIETTDDLIYQKEVLKTGLNLFEELYGYRSKNFVPTNAPFNNSLEKDLYEHDVKFIASGRKQKEPLGNGQYKTNIRFIGSKNQYNQIYTIRNCFFEPSSSGYAYPSDTDWINNCLKEIEIAFRWNKPAIISSHRVNYIGYLHPENREKSLKQLSELFSRMLKRWPDIEFMTSSELGDLIANKK